MSKFASSEFWWKTFDRAVSTFAQTALASFVIGETGLIGLDHIGVLSIAGGAAVASILQSVAFRGRDDTPHDPALRA